MKTHISPCLLLRGRVAFHMFASGGFSKGCWYTSETLVALTLAVKVLQGLQGIRVGAYFLILMFFISLYDHICKQIITSGKSMHRN